MIAYIQTDDKGLFYNVNGYVAYKGFEQMGWEIRLFEKLEEISEPDPEILVVGGIGMVENRLVQLGMPKTGAEIDYPAALEGYLGRKVWASTVEEVQQHPEWWPLFMKPRNFTKKFAGTVIRRFADFIGLVDADGPTAVWCSELVEMRTEWRCYVRYGELLDVRPYKGAWDSKIDLAIVRQAIQDFVGAPAAYGLDFAVNGDGKMLLVEANDGHSLGSYGMKPIAYAKFLSARWAEMTGTEDYCRF